MDSKILALSCLFIWFGFVQVDGFQTDFYLFTPATQFTSGERIAADNLEVITNATFDPKLRLTIIVHGFSQNGFAPWISKMRKELMKKENMNIIVVNWEIGASALYDVAAGNTRLVGAQLVKLITKLRRRLNYEPSNVHVIGHSLGAHVAGFAGASLSMRNMKIRRITGLDPARLGFDMETTAVRLDPSDAEFVDVIHTDTGYNLLEGGLGIERISGHVDFYPNGGASQPGCISVGNLGDKLQSLQSTRLFWVVACDHTKVIEYFTSSINHNCSRKAFPCESWEAFKQGRCFKCEGACPEMGYNADQYHVNGSHKFYLSTLNTAGYCAPQQYVSIVLSGLKSGFWLFDVFGSKTILIKLIDQNDKMIQTKRSIVEAGSQISRLVLSDVPLGRLKSIVLWYGGREMYIGKATVQDGTNTYTACFNKWISGSFFSYSRYATKLRTRDHHC